MGFQVFKYRKISSKTILSLAAGATNIFREKLSFTNKVAYKCKENRISFKNENRQEVIKASADFLFLLGNSRKEERAERKNSDTLIFFTIKANEDGKEHRTWRNESTSVCITRTGRP